MTFRLWQCFYKIDLVFYKSFYPLITNNREPWCGMVDHTIKKRKDFCLCFWVQACRRLLLFPKIEFSYALASLALIIVTDWLTDIPKLENGHFSCKQLCLHLSCTTWEWETRPDQTSISLKLKKMQSSQFANKYFSWFAKLYLSPIAKKTYIFISNCKKLS